MLAFLCVDIQDFAGYNAASSLQAMRSRRWMAAITIFEAKDTEAMDCLWFQTIPR